MKSERYEIGAVTVLRLEGEIDEGGMDVLRDAILECVRDQRCNLVANMAGITFVSYMGVGVLMEGLRVLRTYGGDLKLSGVNLYTDRLFRMVGVGKIFETYDNEEPAVNSYRQAA